MKLDNIVGMKKVWLHKKQVLKESYIKTDNGKIIYYTASPSKFLGIINNKFKGQAVRAFYDFKKNIFVFTNADMIHTEILNAMLLYSKIYSTKSLYDLHFNTDEKQWDPGYITMNYLDPYCAMFQVLPDDDFKKYSMGDGYSTGWFTKIEDWFICCRSNEYKKCRDNVPLFNGLYWTTVDFYLHQKEQNKITESVNDNYLYHVMWLDQYKHCKLINTLFSHRIYISSQKYQGKLVDGISLTRNPRFCHKFMENQIQELRDEVKIDPEATFSHYIGDNDVGLNRFSNLSYVILTFDKNKLKQKYKLLPLAFLGLDTYYSNTKPFSGYGDESEELLITKDDFKGFMKYVVDVKVFKKELKETAEYGKVNWKNDMDAVGNVPATINHNLFATMFPRQFLNLCPPISDNNNLDELIKSKKPIGIPFLSVEPDFINKKLFVYGHEGRHRVSAIMNKNSNVDVPVAILFPESKKYNMPSIDELRRNWTIVSQDNKKEYRLGQFSLYDKLPEEPKKGLYNIYESVLMEGIQEVKKYFPLINDNDFMKLIKMDPTYKGGDQLGTYGKWILSLYNTFLKDKEEYRKWEEQKKLGNNYPEPDKKSSEQIEDFDKIPNLLKKAVELKFSNMTGIKSTSDLYIKLKNISSQQKTNSTNEKVKHVLDLVEKSVEKGGEIVYKDNDWLILIPKKLESSVVFSQDTNWCTTASNGKAYRHYLRKCGGKYFINVNLKNGELYQFHLESGQFMDSNDNSINYKLFFEKYPFLFEFYKKYVYHLRTPIRDHWTSLWYFMDDTDIPYENKIKALKRNPDDIKYLKNPNEKIQLVAVKEDGRTIRYIKNPSEAVQLAAVKQNGMVLNLIDNPSEAVQLAAVKSDGLALELIKNPTEEMKLIAVKSDGYAIELIKNPTEEMKLIAVKDVGGAINYIKNPSEAVQLAAVKQDDYAINYIKNPTQKVKALYKKLTEKK